MVFSRIERALALCDAQLASAPDQPAATVELESLLVSAAVVIVVADLEGLVAEAFKARGGRCGDRHVSNFVARNTARRFWTPDLSKIHEVLAEFDPDCRVRFKTTTENSRVHASWDNVIRARHDVVHGRRAPNLTLRELRVAVEDCKAVLATLHDVLGEATSTPGGN